MTEPPSVEEKSTDAQAEQLRQARMRGLFAVGGTIVFLAATYMLIRGCSESAGLPTADTCKTNADCEGLGVECLHAPTSTYCTHSCDRNEECGDGFHCESPPWEKNTTRALCLKNVAPPPK